MNPGGWPNSLPRQRAPGIAGRSAGFTLLELLVVIVIIGLLISYVAPKYFSEIDKSEVTVARAQMESFGKALDAYRLDVGRYPTTAEGLTALLAPPPNVARWNGPYLRKGVPLDPWGHPYLYRSPGPRGDFEIRTLGRNGGPGSTGKDTGIAYP